MIRQCIRPEHDIDAKMTEVITFRLGGIHFLCSQSSFLKAKSLPNLFLGIGGVSERYRFLRSLGAAQFLNF